jgi:hypothetical protein
MGERRGGCRGTRGADEHDLVEERNDANRMRRRARTGLATNGVGHVREVVLWKENCVSKIDGKSVKWREHTGAVMSTYGKIEVSRRKGRKEVTEGGVGRKEKEDSPHSSTKET